MNMRFFLNIFKVCLSIFLLWFLFSSVDMGELTKAFYSSNPYYIILALFVNTCGVLLSVYRWMVLLKVLKIFVPFKKLLSISLVSGFFSTFLPSGFGGDVVRGYDMFRYSNHGVGVFASIIVERFFALLSLVAIGGFSLLIGFGWLSENTLLLRSIVAIYICIVLLFIGLFNRKILGIAVPVISKIPVLSSFKTTAERFIESIEIYKGHNRVLISVVIMSLVLQSIGIIYYYIISLSLSLDVPFLAFFITIPLIWVATMAPVSAGGMGVREGMFVLLLSNIGISATHALLLSLLGTAVVMPFALTGSIIYVSRKGFQETRPDLEGISKS